MQQEEELQHFIDILGVKSTSKCANLHWHSKHVAAKNEFAANWLDAQEWLV
jgi:hypothetical protein